MTSVLARIGQLDKRRILTTLWTSGKSKRGVWICECKATTAVKVQGRGYSDDAPRTNGAGNFTEETEGTNEDETESQPRGWGLGIGKRSRRNDTGDDIPAGNRLGVDKSFYDRRRPDLTQEGVPPIEDAEQQDRRSWEQFEAAEDAEFAKDGGASASAETAADDNMQWIEESTMLDIDYNEELSIALLRGEADMVARCLFAANQANDLEWIQGIPKTTFSEIIRVLEPSNFIGKLGSSHVEISPTMVDRLNIAPMRRVAFEYNTVLRQAVGIRRSAGVRLTLRDYITLMRSARDLGSQQMGSDMWKALLSDGHTPNTQCYNYYMSAVVWNGVHAAGRRQRVRVVPFNIAARKKPRLSSRYRDYRVGDGGMRETAMRIFNEMLANGAIADEESFRNLMIAAAREGDVSTVKSVLKKVWGIDVEAILAGKPEDNITPKQLPAHSPLMPRTSLLWTIAHAFGVNNDIPTALRIVDFVARHYNLQISLAVWTELFTWTFVLACRRKYGTAKRSSSNIGQLPPESLMRLWETMTGEPYRIEPTIGMYDFLIKNLFERQCTPQIIDYMAYGHELYIKHKDEAYELRDRLKEQIRQRATGYPHDSIEKLRIEWEHADLIRQRDLFRVKRWVRLLLGSVRDWTGGKDWDGTIFARRLPALLWHWRGYAPTEVRYSTTTGWVEIDIRTRDEMLAAAMDKERQEGQESVLITEATRYVGHTWVMGGERQPARRLEEFASSLAAGDDGAIEP